MSRRGNSEGSIYKRNDGRWEAKITIQGDRRKSLYGKTRREVQEQLTEALRAQRHGRFDPEPSQKVSGYLGHWLEDQARPSVRPRTYESYALNVRRLTAYIGNIRLDRLRPNHLQHCYAELLKTGLSTRSVQQAHGVLRVALRQAVRWGLLTQSPTAAVTPPRSPRREMQPLTPEQVQALLASSADDSLHPLWVLLVTTGLRIGEATGLEWQHIDLDRGTLVVRQALQRQQGKGWVLVEPKTGRSRRTVCLAGGTIEALRRHRDRQKLTGAEPRWDGKTLVFCTGSGKPLAPSNIRRSLHRTLKQASLPLIRVHDLRHTAATYLLSVGTHPKVVQELLGHSTVTLTLDTYSHVLPALHKQVASHMDDLISNQNAKPDEPSSKLSSTAISQAQ